MNRIYLSQTQNRSMAIQHEPSYGIPRYYGMALIFSTATVGRVADGNEGSALFTQGTELWTLKKIYSS
ncbi:hypothetical protein GJ744_000822 [Endocarpon pusillum]|uniref:Uncharacterized protein n=1 Tax=Endocarpon pusillum TaxID=364733 RepID=A0A8H7EAD1_9EURO|nr:hypothetical protein GJ744_000822 [Endocarpon pusillum]